MDKSYTGFYKDNQMDGFGVMKWTDGREYRGFWKEDKKHGYGIQTNLDGSSVSATFIDNNQNFTFNWDVEMFMFVCPSDLRYSVQSSLSCH